MLILVTPDDSNAVRNRDMILDHYARMINGKGADTGTRFFDEGYIQHNPLMADGRGPLAEFFSKVAEGRDNSRIVVHKMIAVGDYVFTHVNFLNFFSDDPDDTSIGTCCNLSAIQRTRRGSWGPDIPRANSNGMFEETTPVRAS